MALVLNGDFSAKHDQTARLPSSMSARMLNPLVFTGFFAIETQKAGMLPTGLARSDALSERMCSQFQRCTQVKSLAGWEWIGKALETFKKNL